MEFKIIAALVLLAVATATNANKYARRTMTRGVFPVLEAEEDYHLNKRAFFERQAAGKPAPDCKPCPPFDPEAVEKGDTHCGPGLKPVKRCDAKCGCESWDCVRENCDAWIEANKANFTGPCVNALSGKADPCQTRTKEEWTCGCKIKSCERNCDESRGPLPLDFKGCDKDCSTDTYDACSCKLPKCQPLVVPTPEGAKCSLKTKKCPKCFECKSTKPYGDKCAKLFPKEHVVGECKPKPAPEPNCDICKNQIAIVVGKDECGHPIYKCETKPVADKDGKCEYCETPLVVNVEHCKGQKKGDMRTICETTDPVPTPPTCPVKDCDYCKEDAKPVLTGNPPRCRGTCAKETCEPHGLLTGIRLAPKKECCTGANPAGDLQKERDHELCNRTVCVFNCKKREEAFKCDACTQKKVPAGGKDDCGCEKMKCVDLPAPGPKVPEEGCGDCMNEITVPLNPNNEECTKKTNICVKKTAIYQIVKKPSEIVLPEDPEDPTDKYREEKQKIFELADQKTVEEMEPEAFKEALKKLPDNAVAQLKGGKVVVKTTTKPQPTPKPVPTQKPDETTGPTSAPTPEPTGEPSFEIKPEGEVDKPIIYKVFVYTPDKCPHKPETPAGCYVKEPKFKLCDCKKHEVVPVKKCNKECPSKCVAVNPPKVLSKPVNENCTKIEKVCPNVVCEDLGLKQCTGEKTNKIVDCVPGKSGAAPKKTCFQKSVTAVEEKVTILPKTLGLECCKPEPKQSEGKCEPKKCPEVECNEICEERRVIKESDECGCALTKCVPISACKKRCGKCEECKMVEDPKAGCKTYKCLPKETQKPDRCHKAETQLINGTSVVMLDECGNERIIKDCPVPVEILNGCPEHQYKCDVKDECDCSLCKPNCCCKCPVDDPNIKCGPCEVKEQEFSRDGRCTKTKCVKKVCDNKEAPNCPNCERTVSKTDKCGCSTLECARIPCAPLGEIPKECKKGLLPNVVTDKCGCKYVPEDKPCIGEYCSENDKCKKGETCIKKVCKCKKVLTPCQEAAGMAKVKALKDPNIFIPKCNDAGKFVARQCKDGICWCVMKNGKKMEGTESSTLPLTTCEAIQQ